MSDPAAQRLRQTILERFPDLARVGAAEAWLVGGTIRDAISGRPIADADLALAGAGGEALRFAAAVSGRLVQLGADRFATWRVVAGPNVYDFAELTGGTIDADLGRRDFTADAVALPLTAPAVLVDPFHGVRDIEARTLRMVREENFADDPLRVLKGIRMAATLHWEVEPQTMEAMRRCAPLLAGVAPERLGAEVDRMFREGDLRIAAPLLSATGVDLRLFEVPVSGLERLPPGDPALLFAFLFRNDGAALERTAGRLRWPATLQTAIRRAIDTARRLEVAGDRQVDVILYDAGEDGSYRASMLLDASGKREAAATTRSRLDVRGPSFFSMEALLDGGRIAALAGLPPGPKVGAIKRALLERQILGEVNSVAEAEAFVANLAR